MEQQDCLDAALRYKFGDKISSLSIKTKNNVNTIERWEAEIPQPSESEWDDICQEYWDVIPMKQLRVERTKLLSKTDWWAGSDRTMTVEQTAYRKKLRDLPSTASPKLDSDGRLTNVTWPVEP